MYCEYCGTKNNKEAKFCEKCGNKMNNNISQDNIETIKNIKNNFLILIGVVSIILGVISIVIGWSIYYYDSYEEQKTYGGDAYTGIQNASSKTANNINNFAKAYVKSYNMFMTFIGATMISGGTLAIVYNCVDEKIKQSKKGNKK